MSKSILPSKIYKKHNGKVASKWSFYLNKWDKYFPEFVNSKNSILEIGVQNGGSLEIWAKYFTKAKYIIGCDIDPACKELSFEDPRIKIFIGDVNQEEVRKKIISEVDQIDIIIDDGSHICRDVIKSFTHYFPLLANNGLYIVEDLHASYWKSHEGGLFSPYTSMSFFKRLCDIINNEHWRNGLSLNDFLSGFAQMYDLDILEGSFYNIHSIEFSNSMCIIRKRKIEDNIIDPLINVGTDSAVTDKAGISIEGWNSIFQLCPEINDDSKFDCFNLIKEANSQSQEIAELNQVINGQNQRLTELDQVINSQNQRLTELDQVINSQNQRLTELDQVINSQSQEIAELNQVIDSQSQEENKLNQIINKQSNEICIYKKAMDEIYKSRTWRYGSRVAKIVHFFFFHLKKKHV